MSDLPEGKGVDPRTLLHLDTETTGLAGGTGTQVFLLGMGRLQGEVLVVRQYLLTRFAGEHALLSSARDWMQGAEAIVSYNGKSFDVPLLSARCRDGLAGWYLQETQTLGFTGHDHYKLLFTDVRSIS